MLVTTIPLENASGMKDDARLKVLKWQSCKKRDTAWEREKEREREGEKWCKKLDMLNNSLSFITICTSMSPSSKYGTREGKELFTVLQ